MVMLNHQQITVLGATGSIGVSTLEVISLHPEQFSVFALTANSSVEKLLNQILKFKPRYAVLVDGVAASSLRSKLRLTQSSTQVLDGKQALIDVVEAGEVDVVVAAIVGAAGLASTMAAAKKGKRILLANKESLVMAGSLLIKSVKDNDAQLLPVDSEHNAIFQCLPQPFTSLQASGVTRLLLTGSGGPFRTLNRDALHDVTPEQACAHPNWSMGPKISVDSATMMNKGLEFIEACWLFSGSPDEIEIVVHPQSIIHSMVEYQDGSVISQMGQPDMRTPIAYCLGWPDRLASGVSRLNFFELNNLEFYPPDYERFPCLALAIHSIREGGSYPIALNAVNEVAVDAFLSKQIRFTDINILLERVLEKWDSCEPNALTDVIQADECARAMSVAMLASLK